VGRAKESLLGASKMESLGVVVAREIVGITWLEWL